MEKLLPIALTLLVALFGCKNDENTSAQDKTVGANTSVSDKQADNVSKRNLAVPTKKLQQPKTSSSPTIASVQMPRDQTHNPLLQKGGIQVDPVTLTPYSGRWFDLHTNTKVVKTEGVLVSGKKHGLETRYRGDGTKEFDTRFIDGKKHGLETRYRVDGTKELEAYFKDGKKHGLETMYRDDGSKSSETSYKDGQKHGFQRAYAADGSQSSETFFSHGKQQKATTLKPANKNKKRQKKRRVTKPSTPTMRPSSTTIRTRPAPKKARKKHPFEFRKKDAQVDVW